MKRALLLLPLLLLAALWLPPNKSAAPEPEKVREVTLAPLVLTNMGFGVTLRARDGSADQVEMMIGFLEGQSIEMARTKQKTPRPMTHDIFKTFLDRNGWQVERVVVRDVADGAFLADLIFQKDGQKQIYDARPSDSIALAVRYGAKIFVAEKVFDQQRKDREKSPEKRPQRPVIT